MNKNLLIIELNEFSEDLLGYGSKVLNLKNIKKLLKMENSETISPEIKEHHGLDPWVQWVSIHTGVSHKFHKIDHLAETENLRYPQIWEVLSKEGYSSGMWGLMNSKKNEAKNCHFFFPDPWTFNEKAFPKKLNNFLALPRYYAKNYMSPSIKRLIVNIIRLLKFVFFDINIFFLIKEILYAIYNFIKLGILSPSESYQNSKAETYQNILFSLFDLFSAKIFLLYKNKFNPNISFLFLNSLAHAQHKAWNKKFLSKNIIFTLRTVDRILGMFFNQLDKKHSILILNGLSQKNVDGADYYIYRQINPNKFIKKLGIKYIHLEQCMTNESHIFFQNSNELGKAFNLLSSAEVNGKKLFHVEKDRNNDKKLFYQLDFFNSIKKDAKFSIKNKEFEFFRYFSILNRRTGAHTPYGKAYYHNIEIKKSLYNHEIFNEILNFFKK